METHTIPWVWLFVGVILMLMEILAPGFVVFFFGLAAATLGVVLFVVDLSATMQIISFTSLCLLYLFTLRRIAKSIFMGKTTESGSVGSEYIGRIGKVVETIRPEVPGRILLGDAEWAAAAEERLERETEVRVVGQANLTLTVEKI